MLKIATTSYSCSYGTTNRSVYIDEPIFGRADTNDDGDFLDSEEKFYYTSNNLYCVTALLDTSGDIIERYEYTPYGELTIYVSDGGDSDWWDGDETPGSLSGNYYSFTGRRSDPEAGLMYYRNRHYSGELGRFVSTDIYSNRTRLYVYVFGNPLLTADPSGWDALTRVVPVVDPEPTAGRMTEDDCMEWIIDTKWGGDDTKRALLNTSYRSIFSWGFVPGVFEKRVPVGTTGPE